VFSIRAMAGNWQESLILCILSKLKFWEHSESYNYPPFIWKAYSWMNNESAGSEVLTVGVWRVLSSGIWCSVASMEVTCSSETLVEFWWTTQHYIPEDRSQIMKMFIGWLARIKFLAEGVWWSSPPYPSYYTNRDITFGGTNKVVNSHPSSILL
jgi:hypothetical protein